MCVWNFCPVGNVPFLASVCEEFVRLCSPRLGMAWDCVLKDVRCGAHAWKWLASSSAARIQSYEMSDPLCDLPFLRSVVDFCMAVDWYSPLKGTQDAIPHFLGLLQHVVLVSIHRRATPEQQEAQFFSLLTVFEVCM